MFREGLARLLASYGGLEIVAEVPNDQEALRLAQDEKPDVVVMQVQMPFERAKESLLKMRQISPPPKVVVVTMFEDLRYVQELTRLGASAYLLKSVSVEHLIGAVRAAVFDPKGQNVVVGMPREMIEEDQRGTGGVLSVREMEILLLVARDVQPADSLPPARCREYRQAPPGQRLPEDGGKLAGGGGEEGALRRVDHHPRLHRRRGVGGRGIRRRQRREGVTQLAHRRGPYRLPAHDEPPGLVDHPEQVFDGYVLDKARVLAVDKDARAQGVVVADHNPGGWDANTQ